jgi:hypothetical protein
LSIRLGILALPLALLQGQTASADPVGVPTRQREFIKAGSRRSGMSFWVSRLEDTFRIYDLLWGNVKREHAAVRRERLV